jgi:hypothetical protein
MGHACVQALPDERIRGLKERRAPISIHTWVYEGVFVPVIQTPGPRCPCVGSSQTISHACMRTIKRLQFTHAAGARIEHFVLEVTVGHSCHLMLCHHPRADAARFNTIIFGDLYFYVLFGRECLDRRRFTFQRHVIVLHLVCHVFHEFERMFTLSDVWQ